tara:strand:- start:642 stop:908 length:267 start_codon:yes stop_codon:yes gene_type:complete
LIPLPFIEPPTLGRFTCVSCLVPLFFVFLAPLACALVNDLSATGVGGGGGGGGSGTGGGLGVEKHMVIIPWDLLVLYVVRHKYPLRTR